MDDDQVSVSQSEPGPEEIININNMKLRSLKKGKFTDCVFLVGPIGKQEKVHALKGMLMMCSPYMEGLFRNSPESPIVIEHIEPHIFRLMIEFIHLGQLVTPTNCEEVADLVVAADHFLVESLKVVCKELLQEKITVDLLWPVLDKILKVNLEDVADFVCSSVSWIRKRDLHILTAGIYTYTSDARFQVVRPERSENWTLQVKFPQERDAGIYECQVNTEPKLSLAFRLNVIEAKARILGQADLHVKTGSTISLSCVISQGPHDLGTVFWYHGPTIIDYDSARGGVKIETEWTDSLTSRLRITNARITDSGNYTCIPTIAAPASVMVHVINGEHPAAMQHGNKNHSNGLLNNLSLILVHSFTVFLIKWLR